MDSSNSVASAGASATSGAAGTVATAAERKPVPGRQGRRNSATANEQPHQESLPASGQNVGGAGARRPSISKSAGSGSGGKGANGATGSATGAPLTSASNAASNNVSLFAHLPQFDRSAILTSPTASITSQLLKTSKESVIHPAIVKLGLAYADYSIMGASERCRHMLLAFKQVFRDYQAPSDQAISRHLEAHLRPLIAFLVQARPLAISMGHAIRHLKLKISTLPPDTTESEARDFMCAVIDNYIRNRIDLSDQLIAQHGGTKISDGDVILTFAHSRVVEKVLVSAAVGAGKRFRAIVIDSRPFLEGRRMLERLSSVGIGCTYLHLNAVGHVMKEVTKVFLGAHALFSNGALLSRVGTATVALLAKNRNKPVIVCCETLKFSDRLQLDSIVYNEIGDPDALVITAARNSTNPNGQVLKDWRASPNLKVLNILYDVTPPEFISLVISEIGLIPVTSIPVVLREYMSTGNNTNN